MSEDWRTAYHYLGLGGLLCLGVSGMAFIQGQPWTPSREFILYVGVQAVIMYLLSRGYVAYRRWAYRRSHDE